MNLQQSIERLEKHINEIPFLLKNIHESELSYAPKGQWSRKQEFGHLIDSALNNIHRFVKVQFEEKPYKIISYNQDQWVEAQDYQHHSFEEMLSLWRMLNIQVVRILQNIKEHQLTYKCIAPEGNEIDLDFLIKDYVDHMDHHFTHIFQPAD